MHTVLIHQAFVSPNGAGGTRHIELAKPFVGKGNEFTIIASRYNYLDGKEISADEAVEQYDGVRVIRPRSLGGLHRSYVWRVVSFLSFMVTSVWAGVRVKNIDVVLGTSPPLFQAVSAWLVAAIRRRPLILEIRDLWPEFAIDIGLLKNPFLIWMARRLESFLYGRASHFIVNSPAYVDYLESKGIAKSKISFIANGVDPTAFKVESTGSKFRQDYHLEGKFLVTYAGAVGMANDLDQLLDAANQLTDLPEIQFVVVGDGKERPRLEQRAAELGLENVLFTGTRPKSAMPGILAESDACLAILKDIPMFRNTYPNKVFDYMAAGKPVVLAIDGVIRKVVEEARSGVFTPPGNSTALAGAIRDLYQNQNECVAMGERGRDFVIEHFNRSAHAAQFDHLVHQVSSRQAA